MALKRKTTTRVGTKTAATTQGLGAGGTVTVKGARATSTQRAAIDAVLSEASSEGASRRVMIATIMAATQESGLLTSATNGSHLGLFQQDPNWGSESDRRDATASTRAFLKGWKRENGSLKNAPGDLAAGIEKVQASGQGSLYAQWEKEATATVQAWQGSDGQGTSSTSGASNRYEFTRGERHGAREDSWDASGRLTEEVGWRRWAATNVLFVASEDELRAQAASVTIDGDESWLLGRPQWEWSSGRAVTEITIRVLADRWAILPGAVVMLNTPGPTQGRWLVSSVTGDRLDSPEVDVILKRPTRHKLEPAADDSSSSSGSSGSSSSLRSVCSHISGQDRDYLYGGGHGPALAKIADHDPLDCSSSCSLALKRAGMFPGTVAITSGAFASSWGKPGKGRDFTVWANDSHVWIEGYGDDGSFAWRFDTSPQGSGPSGPHLRLKPRTDQARFTARHWS